MGEGTIGSISTAGKLAQPMKIEFARAAEAGGLVTRRNALGGIGMAALALPMMGARAAGANENLTRRHSGFGWNDPAENLRILSRMWGTIEPGKEAFLYVFGPMFGMTDAGNFRPLFRMESIAAVRTYPQAGGAYRYLAGQIILFTDFDTGEVLDTWANPYLDGEVCKVFQYRDYPLDYVLDPVAMPARYDIRNKDDMKRKLVLDWYFRGDMAFGDAIAKTRLKNRLDPAEWPRESVGDWWETFEAYRWQAKIAEVEDLSLPSIPSFTGDFQTFKPWEPWMLMGQRPGKIFSVRTAFKIPNFDVVPRKVMAYAEKHMAEFLHAPTKFDKSYKLNDAHFKEQRKPVPLPSKARP
jgi:hypothetical protein